MAYVGVDFGTGNTVLAVFNETLGRAETVAIPGVTTEMTYRVAPDAPEQVVQVIPSLIHFSETEILIGDQVLSRGLAEHKHTFRWMKRAIAHHNSQRRKTPQGHKSAAEAGQEFLKLLLHYAAGRISLDRDEFTFTAPTEAFETFHDWLRTVVEEVGIRRFRLLDEPTACVLGYHGAARRDDVFAIFDFGCGTLDVSVVKVDFSSAQDRKATQLGQAGRDLGGMDLDRWLSEDFSHRHELDEADRRELEAQILRQAETTKIALSDPTRDEETMTVLNHRHGTIRSLRTKYRRGCGECERGRAGAGQGHSQSCLGCLLLTHEFVKGTRETLDRALEHAAMKGVARSSIIKVLATGGTSLVPCVGGLLRDYFDGRVEFQSPFDAVARGACRGEVQTTLQHDYAIESLNRSKQCYEFVPLFKIGTEYPTSPQHPVKLWAMGYDGMTRIGLKIFEVSRMKRQIVAAALVDEHGALREQSRVASEFSYVCLNPANPTFITADPPLNAQRDQKRFLCSFTVDGQRRLLVTVVDHFNGKTLLQNHPVVRL